jgi:glucosamine-6-phosphate deaminase
MVEMEKENGGVSTSSIKLLPSKVEGRAVEKSGRRLQYLPEENLPIIEVDNFPQLGKVVAARFIEWAQQNPGGVISLPTGRTPEHFIKWVKYFLDNWDLEQTKGELAELGLEDTAARPDMKSLHFFQMDEFFPINPEQKNSFSSYVKKQYAENFGLDMDKVWMMDTWTLGCREGRNNGDLFDAGIDVSITERKPLTHLEREQSEALTAVRQYCCEYEEKIRSLGGIGFFLGGIGPDGHVAFNCKGTDHNSITRLTQLNYMSAAAAASDLGGIETARKKYVITIGLGTIKFNPGASVVVFAAGDAKAQVIANAVKGPKHVSTPASAFYSVPGFRFYLTKSACTKIDARIYDTFRQEVRLMQGVAEQMAKAKEFREMVKKVIIDLSLKCKTKLQDLQSEHFAQDRRTIYLIEELGFNGDAMKDIVSEAETDIKRKIETSLLSIQNASFIHTAPHHDDIMLGYLPLVNVMRKETSNSHTFVYATSGFNAVTNELFVDFLAKALDLLQRKDIQEAVSEGSFDQEANGDAEVVSFMDAHAARDELKKDEVISLRVIRCVARNFSSPGAKNEDEGRNLQWLRSRIQAAIAYYSSQYLGAKDSTEYQTLKGMLREFEADLLWGYHGFSPSESVSHLRMGFYKGELFTEDPEINRDVLPLLELMKEKRPNYVSVALDPEGSGPDTHYKVLQAVSAACKLYSEEVGDTTADLKIWGYRNVWFRFHPNEAKIMYPVELGEHAHLNDVFETCFISQKAASFPAPEYDGPFSHWAQMIQAEQYQNLVTLLGADYFKNHSSPRMRAARGFVFINELNIEEFLRTARGLKYNAEG